MTWDWDWMDCHHGYYVSPQNVTGDDHCNCDPGWTGFDCSLCASASTCASGQICDKTMIITDYKAFNCTSTDTSLIPTGGSIGAQWSFPSNGTATGVVSVYVGAHGAPFLFNCTFDDCSKSIDTTSNSEVVTCSKTSCHCSSWCGIVVAGIIKKMKGAAIFSCSISDGTCGLHQDQLPLAINLRCTAASCQQGPYVPPTPEFSNLAIGLMVAGGVGLLASIIGTSIFIYTIMQKRERRRLGQYHGVNEDILLTLSWHNIECKIGKRKVLHDVSGIAHPGHITAILGPSGAGKTTFLDMLAGRKNTGDMGGQILVNGQPRNRSWKRLSGYVLQDDRMMGTLTVREHLEFIAELRLPASMHYDHKMTRVEEVLQELGIAHIANSKIGTQTTRGISGGERRRLAIASELITDPPILFLDEPTSGLDSYTAFALMDTLKKLAVDKKRTIIVSIHQPRSNIYTLFDSLLVLSGGEAIYFGPSKEATNYFAALGYECPPNFNPADHIIDVVSMNSNSVVKELALRYRESYLSNSVASSLNTIQTNPVPAHINSEYMQEYASPFYKQLWILSKRVIRNNLRNFYLMPLQYSLTIGLAFILGGIFWHLNLDLAGVQDRAGCIFFSLALLSFGSMSSIDTFYEERALFLRERANGMYRTSTYFLAKAMCDVLPMRIIPPLLLGGISYYMVGLRAGYDHFFWYMLTLTLVSLVAGSMCLCISTVVPSLGVGNLLAILLLLFYLLFAGFLLNKNHIPVVIRWFGFVSFLQYGFEILMVNELQWVSVWFNPADIPPSEYKFVDGHVFLDQFGMDPSRFYTDLIVLASMIGFYLGLSYILLRFATKERR